jgi:hypothetical protein
VLALRGRLSLKASSLRRKPLLADPGLVAPDLIDSHSSKKVFDVGFILHHKDQKSDRNIGDGLQIDITWPIEDVIDAASMCKSISASSLHGIILADALGLPRQWSKFEGVQGRGHKFYDYFSSLRQFARPGDWKTAPKRLVWKKQEDLRQMLASL